MRSHYLLPSLSFLASLVPFAFAVTREYAGGSFEIVDEIAALPAVDRFLAADVHLESSTPSSKRRWDAVLADDALSGDGRKNPKFLPKRDTVPAYIYVLYCTDAGFRGECGVFGSHPGHCVSWFDYDSKDNNVSAVFNDAVDSLSTNTGGLCQVYNTLCCDCDNSDSGFSVAYAYDLTSTNDSAYIGVGSFNGNDRNNSITSWRC